MGNMQFTKPDNVDDLFRSTTPNKVVIKTDFDEKVITKLEIDKLVPFSNHPFKLYEGKRLDDMVESVKEMGVIVPVVVRELKDKTIEILSGHNRVNAAKIAGLTEVPVVVKYNLADDDALLIVTETNLMQRSIADLPHSERARAFTEHMKAIKYSGVKKVFFEEIEQLSNPDEIRGNEQDVHGEHLGSNRDVIGGKFNLSGSTIARYLRIEKLVDELKPYVDSEEIGIVASVNLSYLRPQEQRYVSTAISSNKCKVTPSNSTLLREKSAVKELDYIAVEKVISGEAAKVGRKKEKKVTLKSKFLLAHFSEDTKPQEIEETIGKALELYFAHQRKERNSENEQIE